MKIDLGDSAKAFGRVLFGAEFAFYDYRQVRAETPPIAELAAMRVAFRIPVMNYAVTGRVWPVIGALPLPGDLLKKSDFFTQDAFTGQLAIYNEDLAPPTYQRPATFAECEALERNAVWNPKHVEDRLRDHFAGLPNKWVESLRIKPSEHFDP